MSSTRPEVQADCNWLNPETLKLTEEQSQHLVVFLDWLNRQESQIKAMAECILHGKSECPDAVCRMRELTDRIREDFPSRPRDVILPLLGRVVHYYNRAHPGRSLPLPEISIPLPRLVPPFAGRRWKRLASYALWSKSVQKDLRAFGRRPSRLPGNTPISPVERAVGRVLVASILWGGNLSREFLMEFYGILPHWNDVAELIGGRVYITFVDTAGNCRRWSPDPITSLLLLGLPELPDHGQNISARDLRAHCDRSILSYFRTLRAKQDAPESVPELLDAALLHFEVRLPRALTEIAAGHHVSYSPDRKTWARLTGTAPGQAEREVAGRSNDCELDSGENSDGLTSARRADEVDGSGWLSTLRELLGAYDKEMTKATAKRRISAALTATGLDPAFRIFLQFANAEIATHSGSSHRLESIHDLVLAVARRLPVLVNLADPNSLSPGTLQGAYSMILVDSTSTSHRRKVAGGLRAFHHFLVAEKLSENIDEHEAFGGSSSEALVDANVVTEDEYVKARNMLISPGPAFPAHEDDQIRHVAGLILILGFRCGLRRQEALKLRPCDVCDKDPAELLIRPWEQRRLKTPSATRKIPLYALLDQQELDWLLGWKRRGPNPPKKDSRDEFLFSLPASPKTYASERRIFALIHRALREATGDDRVHYHVLRHSGCSTWLGFALLQPPDTVLPSWVLRLPLQSAKLDKDHVAWVRKQLYANDFVTRRNLWAISQTMGHASPVTSTRSYIHLNWELLGMWLDAHVPSLTITSLAKMAGISRQFASRLTSSQPGASTAGKMVAQAWARAFPRAKSHDLLGHEVEKAGRNMDAEAAAEEAASMPDRLWQVLHLHAKDGTGADLLAIRFGFSEDFISGLIENAKIASKIKIGKTGFVHKFQVNDKGERLCCPTPLGSAEQTDFVRRFAAKVFGTPIIQCSHRSVIAGHYLTQARDERNGLEFTWDERHLAVIYASFLMEIGMGSVEIEVRCFAGHHSEENWRLLFTHIPALRSLAANRFQAARPLAPMKAAANVIGIKVSPAPVDNKTASTPQASYGFRFLMLLSSLCVMAATHAGAASNGFSSTNSGTEESLGRKDAPSI